MIKIDGEVKQLRPLVRHIRGVWEVLSPPVTLGQKRGGSGRRAYGRVSSSTQSALRCSLEIVIGGRGLPLRQQCRVKDKSGFARVRPGSQLSTFPNTNHVFGRPGSVEHVWGGTSASHYLDLFLDSRDTDI